MKALKLLFAAAAVVTMSFGAQAAAERMKVKLLRTSSDPIRGYWVEYEINGVKFRSDQTGYRINTTAWNAMNSEEKEEVVKAVYGVGSARKLQFGSETARKMGDWYDLRKGWKNGKTILVEKLVDRDFPGLRERFKHGGQSYYSSHFEPKTGYSDCPDEPELNAKRALGRYYICDLAASAYTALENAEYMRTAAAVKSTAGDLIQLICDKCLVPAVSPGINGGIGLFAAPDAVGTAIDYFNSLTGWQDKLQETVVGKRANAESSMEVIRQMDSAIRASYQLIKDCTARAHELKNAVDERGDEWAAAKKARTEQAESDALVLKYRDYHNPYKTIYLIRNRSVATADIAARIEALDQECRVRQKARDNARTVEERRALQAAFEAAVAAYVDYVEGQRKSIKTRAENWKATFDEKAGELRAIGQALKAPEYPGAGTAWDNKRLYNSMQSYTADPAVVAKAASELKDYADKAEAYHLSMHDLAEDTLTLADEIFESAQPIYNDYCAVMYESDGTPRRFSWGEVGEDYGPGIAGLQFSDIYHEYNWDQRRSDYYYEFTEDDLFYLADPAFMEDVCEARSYAKLCENYPAALESRRRYQTAQNSYRTRIAHSVVAAKAAFQTADAAYQKSISDIPGYVKEQQYHSYSEPGFHAAGGCLNMTTVDTELRRKFVDTTGTIALADAYRNELDQCVAGHTVALLGREDAYRESWYLESVATRLEKEFSSIGTYSVPSHDTSEDNLQKLQDLQSDFNGRPYGHRAMFGALGELDQTQEAFVKNASASTGEGSDYVLERIRRDSSFYSGTTKPQFQDAARQVRTAAAQTAAPSTKYDPMGHGSYAYHVPDYYERMNLPVKNPHKTLVQPLYDEIRDIRAKVKSGQVDPTWQLRLVKNDGTSVVTNITCCYGIPHRMPTADVLQWAKPGHALKGWGATSNATVVAFAPDAFITNSTKRSVTKTYYAMWTLLNEKHTLACDPMGGTLKTTKYTVTVGKSTYSTLGVPTRRGFKFLGWYDRDEGGRKVFDASGKAMKGGTYWDAKGNWIYEADVTVYAHWSVDPNGYVIRFHKCDGTGLMREVGFVHGASTALPTCANGLGWKSGGKLFKGWATSLENAVRGIVWKPDGAAVSTATAKGKTMDVYAVWETPMIRFVAGGGSGSMSPLKMGANEVRKLPKCTFRPPAGKKAFAGWACSNKRRYDDEMLVFNLGSVTMTAIWK